LKGNEYVVWFHSNEITVEILDKMAFVSRIELIKRHAIAAALGINAPRDGRFSSIGVWLCPFIGWILKRLN
jgi:hypothetical protein